MKWWVDFVHGFNSPAGNLVACLVLVLFLTPFLFQNNPKAWEALTFILGVIGGLVRGATLQNEPPTTPKQQDKE
jgi:fluoride ion exporter CrcB/FEX